ncbi:probable disease resistance protein At1g15890 [Eutrema salsugineum]|uniref:probable disease resistance protein At1g15890 n=1 Tax=Eutrema salsugineum TaxID=72664 RepID=UPI000CED7EDF|nr:probable disease resistance protein At1g15890 [Eutrema salsugineum]
MMEANLEALENTLQQLVERRDDLLRRVVIEEDKGLQRLAQVQGWISRVERIEFQVSDVFKAKPTETGRLCLFRYCSKKCIPSCKYGKVVSKKLEEVKILLSEEALIKEVAGKAPVPKVGKKHIQTTVGLESMVEKAWNSLMDVERRILGLYGMGGVGKTTLLARINNKFVDEFDVVIWVVVSKDLQNEGIQNQILGRLGLDEKRKGETEKASSIYHILSKKKFVLLLDDLWSEVDLNKIGVPPPTRDNGSKIVFTTRSKEVCRDMGADDEMKVDCLSWDEAWELFRNTVGEATLKRHEEIAELAREIAKKCCGLPLALNVIGRAMAYKEGVHEWRYALEVLNLSSHKFKGMDDKILPILKFSYDDLKDQNVRSCFLYCSLFPEDYEIEKERLIEYWIGEGFINGNRGEDGSNNQGHAIIGSLVRAHLLMDVDRDAYLAEKVKMHDVLREMALWIGKEEETVCVKSGAKLRHIPNDIINWKVARRISLMSNQIEEISCSPKCPNLSTLFLGDNKLKVISGEFFRFMPALAVLDLSQIRSIGGIGTSLPNLQVLKLIGSCVYIDAGLMEELQLLEHLKILTANVNDALILESIQKVERLASSLRVLFLDNISAEVVVLNTVALRGLQSLVIWYCKISEIKTEWESKEREEILCTSSQGFKHLSDVRIRHSEGPKDLTWLLFAQNLRSLFVDNSKSIEEIINREKGMSISNVLPHLSVPFRKLEHLRLFKLDELRSICSNSLVLPNLREFKVYYCPKSRIKDSQ